MNIYWTLVLMIFMKYNEEAERDREEGAEQVLHIGNIYINIGNIYLQSKLCI